VPRLWALALALSCGPALAGGPRHVTLQRSAAARAVTDCYIWEEQPGLNGNSDTLYVGLVGATDKRTFLRFEVPTNVEVLDARLHLTTDSTGGRPIRVHEVTKAWEETEPKWSTFFDAHKPAAFTTVTPALGRVSIDLTGLAREWAQGGQNYGVVLLQDTLTPSTTFFSSESGTASLRPTLDLVVQDPPEQEQLVQGPVPPLEASCGVELVYPLRAHAPAATTFSLAPGTAPAPRLDGSTGELRWTPTSAQAGAHRFTVTASDGARSSGLDVEIDVKCVGPLRVGCSGTPGLPWAALALLALLRRARRGA